MTDLLSIWERLDLGGSATDGRVRLRVPGSYPLDVFAARSLESGFESILLELPTRDLPAELKDPRSKGFNLLASPISPGPSGRTRIVLERTSDRFTGVFRTLARDVVEHLEGQESATEAVRIALARLHRWQAFLSRHGPDGLSVEARRGLFGELWCLRQLVSSGMDPGEAVKSWRGPEAANQDFQFRCGAIEVKTTAAVTPHLIRFSNVVQLDDGALDWLLLLVIVIEEGDAGQWALLDLVDDLARRLEESARDDFHEKLLEMGLLDSQRHLYRVPRYAVRRMRLFRVEEEFPRLLGRHLPAGIVEVQHAVEIGAMLPWERDIEEMVSCLREGGAVP